MPATAPVRRSSSELAGDARLVDLVSAIGLFEVKRITGQGVLVRERSRRAAVQKAVPRKAVTKKAVTKKGSAATT